MDGETRFTVKWGKQWGQSLIEWCFLRRALGLKTKITFLIVLIVAGVLFLSGYLDFHLARKAHIDLYLDRNLYIAKQIDIAIPDQKMMANLSYIHDEIEEWLLSRPSLMEIDVFLFTAKGWEMIVSNSKETLRSSLVLTADQLNLAGLRELSRRRQGPLHGDRRREVASHRVQRDADHALASSISNRLTPP